MFQHLLFARRHLRYRRRALFDFPGVRPGGEILLRVAGWRKVVRVLQALDMVEALGIDPADALRRSIGAMSTIVCSSMKGLVRTRKRVTKPGSGAER